MTPGSGFRGQSLKTDVLRLESHDDWSRVAAKRRAPTPLRGRPTNEMPKIGLRPLSLKDKPCRHLLLAQIMQGQKPGYVTSLMPKGVLTHGCIVLVRLGAVCGNIYLTLTKYIRTHRNTT